jgi:hypothetical protein
MIAVLAFSSALHKPNMGIRQHKSSGKADGLSPPQSCITSHTVLNAGKRPRIETRVADYPYRMRKLILSSLLMKDKTRK